MKLELTRMVKLNTALVFSFIVLSASEEDDIYEAVVPSAYTSAMSQFEIIRNIQHTTIINVPTLEEERNRKIIQEQQDKVRREAEKLQQEKIRQEQEKIRKETDRLKQEKIRVEQEKIRKETERLEQEKIRQEQIHKEAERLKQEKIRQEEQEKWEKMRPEIFAWFRKMEKERRQEWQEKCKEEREKGDKNWQDWQQKCKEEQAKSGKSWQGGANQQRMPYSLETEEQKADRRRQKKYNLQDVIEEFPGISEENLENYNNLKEFVLKKFRKLSIKYHPDKNTDKSDSDKKLIEEKQKTITGIKDWVEKKLDEDKFRRKLKELIMR